jgi:hypothetical protein
MLNGLRRKRVLLTRAAVSVLVAIGLKLAAHWLGWEFLSLNPLFSGIVAANVFLMGFLLSGVLNDYKESERLPGEIAASLELFSDEAMAIYSRSKEPVALEFACFVGDLAVSIRSWFFKRERTTVIMARLADFNRYFLAFEPLTQANFIVRLKQEQHALRRVLIRIHTIRETSFISSGYLIAELTTLLLATGLILVKIDPFYESLFFVGVIMFLLSYLILLIRDLDNPFGYYEGASGEDVSLKPLEDCIGRITARDGAVPAQTSPSAP